MGVINHLAAENVSVLQGQVHTHVYTAKTIVRRHDINIIIITVELCTRTQNNVVTRYYERDEGRNGFFKMIILSLSIN